MRHPPRRVRVEARAKLNLGLAIGPRRPDGYHDLATVFQSVSLADTLTIERRARGFTLEVRHQDMAVRRGRTVRHGAARIPRGGSNLVIRAARLLAARFSLPGGAHFHLTKRIPAGAGMGGGSADAAAALVGLARLHGIALPWRVRRTLGLELGSDVPFALLGGTAIGLGRGERLRRTRLATPFRALIALPDWRVSTASAFRAVDRGKYGLTRWSANLRFVQRLGRKAITAQDAVRLGNTFEGMPETHRSGFVSLRDRLLRAGLEAPHMTGSGSAVFGLIPSGSPGKQIVQRFTGSEAVFLVRSRGRGLTNTKLA